MQTAPPTERDLRAGDHQAIPPGVPHALALTDGSVEVDFLVPPPADAND
jgi:quercetin dioxygenase-like cupin family protein